MSRTSRIVASATAIAAAGIGVGGAAVASGTDDGGERPITGVALDRASVAALAETGSGQVTGTEVGDEESYYEVEVTLPDGSEVDVQLDRELAVVGTEHDGELEPGDD